jgi:hypothetical protein
MPRNENVEMFAFTICNAKPWSSRTLYANKAIELINGVETVIREYDNVTYWWLTEKSVPNVEAFAAALDWLADRPTMMIVRGAVKAGTDLTLAQYRRFVDPDETTNSFVAVRRKWVGFDFDDLLGPPGLGAGDQLDGAGKYARLTLPEAFWGCKAVVGATASTGLQKNLGTGPHGEDKLRLRLFFHLQDEISDLDLTNWTKGVAFEGGVGLDYCTCETIQPIYTTRSTFVGMGDPVPVDKRVVILDGVESVALPRLYHYIGITVAEQMAQRTFRRKAGKNWRAVLKNELGGIDGYHRPIWEAIKIGIRAGATDDEMIKTILAAVWERGDRGRIARYDGRYVMDRIRAFRRLLR